MQPTTIFLDFCDLGRRESKTDHWLLRILRERFDVRVTTSPDFIVYGDAGDVHRMYTCKKIYVGNGEPNFRECDFAVTIGDRTSDGKDERHLCIGSPEMNEHDRTRVLNFFQNIFQGTNPPIAAKKRLLGRWMLVRKNPIPL